MDSASLGFSGVATSDKPAADLSPGPPLSRRSSAIPASRRSRAASAATPESLLRDTLGTEVPGDAIIQYDPETDSIIIITDEETNLQVARVIETLDKPVAQVLIIQHRLFGALVEKMDCKGQGHVVQRISRCAGNTARHVGNTVVLHIIDHIGGIGVGGCM